MRLLQVSVRRDMRSQHPAYGVHPASVTCTQVELKVLHTSTVHLFLSSHSVSALHCWLGLQPAMGAFRHVLLLGLQMSLVHTLMSLQSALAVHLGVGLQLGRFW